MWHNSVLIDNNIVVSATALAKMIAVTYLKVSTNRSEWCIRRVTA